MTASPDSRQSGMLSWKEDQPTTSPDSGGRHPIDAAWKALLDSRLLDGGFALRPGGEFRPDATAWAVIAFAVGGVARDKLASSCTRLAQAQLADGRLPLFPTHPDVVWPTALSVIAWALAGQRPKELARACDFLVAESEQRSPGYPSGPVGHTQAARGWPWVLHSHSWVFPSGCALLALDLAGRSGDARAQEAITVLLDRQLKAGGWNYGNVESFGQALRPFPDTTGLALAALAGHSARGAVAHSLNYLETEARRIRTPWSLGWALLGLSSWGRRPDGSDVWILEALARQQRLGRYDTNSLAVLLAASAAGPGLRNGLPEQQP